MKLQWFYSDFNGLRSDKPYNRKPTIPQIKKAIKQGGFYQHVWDKIIVNEKDVLVEVKHYIYDNLSSNLYRDMYRII